MQPSVYLQIIKTDNSISQQMALAAIFYFGQFFVYRRFSHYEQLYQIKVLQMSEKVGKVLAKSLKVPVK